MQIKIIRADDSQDVLAFKAAQSAELIAPADDMWADGFAAAAPHYAVHLGDDAAGYVVVTEEGSLLQFFLDPAFRQASRAVFAEVRRLASCADLGTNDPLPLALALDVQERVRVHTLLYEYRPELRPAGAGPAAANLRAVQGHELDRVVHLQTSCLDAAPEIAAWLEGYSRRLITRGELYALEDRGEWLGLGESRDSVSQPGITHLGVMVAPKQRGSGWATWILRRLLAAATERERRVVCSTRIENLAAQRAIEHAGFVAEHRMLRVDFRR